MKRDRFRIGFQDRVGMASDVAAVVAGMGANIVAMDVRLGEMYLQLGDVADSVIEIILERIRSIPGVREVEAVEWMPKVRQLAQIFTQPVMISFDQIIHSGALMSRVIDLAKRVAGGNSTILLRGESGTGKELFARAIHMASPRCDRPYVVVNCAAIPDTLLESELFGYADGTFTGGSKGGRLGLFEHADSGTLFLDEVAEIPPHIQAKLLRVLQDGSIRSLGEVLEKKVDVRLVAATNRHLEELVARGAFREDLFYRLNVIPITLPPLRQHKEDIPALVEHFIKKFNESLGKRVESISPLALERLCNYHWPGNTRQLENTIERAMNLMSGEELQAEQIILPLHELCAVDGNELKREIAEVEKQVLIRALREGKSARQAAKLLGVSHTTVMNKIRRYSLSGQKL